MCGYYASAMSSLKLGAFLPYRLSIVSNAVSDAVASTYQAMFGLRIPEWRLITIIAEEGASTQHVLTAATRMDKVTVSRAAIALVERGLVERLPNTRDRRSHLLALTSDGQMLYEQIVPMALEMEQRIIGGLAGEEIDQFRRTLDRIEAAAGGLNSTDAIA